MRRKQTNCNYLFAWHDSKWHVWVTPELVDEPWRASFSRDRDSFANWCKWFLPFEHITGKYQVAENTRLLAVPLKTSQNRKRRERRNEAKIGEFSRFSVHVCWILRPAISCFSWFSSLPLPPFCPSLFLTLFFSFSSSWGQNRNHASPSFPFFGVVHSLASPPHIFSRLCRAAFPCELTRSFRPSPI